MALRTDVERVLVWDRQTQAMVAKTSVELTLLGNMGSVFAHAGPLYVDTAGDILTAERVLKNRLLRTLPGISQDEH